MRFIRNLNKTDVAESAFYQYNDANQLVSAKLFDGKKNTTVTYTYDENGNLVSEIGKYGTDQVETYYDYTVENRLQAVYDGKELLMAAAYDGDGNRVFQLNYNLHTDEDWKGNNGNGNSKDNAGSGNNGNGNGNSKENSKSEGTDDAGYGNATNAEELSSQNQSGILFPIAEEISRTETDLIAMIKTTGKEKNYELIEYISNVNTQYTQVLMEFNENGAMDAAAYTYGVSRLTEDRFIGESNFYLYDPAGNVAGITDQDGYLWQSYRYDAFGNATFGSPQYDNEYTFNGESYNPNIHSQYLRARYYDTVKGSFLTEDTYLGDIRNPLTLNRYSYCIGNPLFYRDPSGHTPQNVIDQVVIDFLEDTKNSRLHDYDLYEAYNARLEFYDILDQEGIWDRMGRSTEEQRISYMTDYNFGKSGRNVKKWVEEAKLEAETEKCKNMLVTLEQIKRSGRAWDFRMMESYNMDTLLPTYEEGFHGWTQDDIYELNRVLEKYEINTPNRIAHFLAQCEEESMGGFKRVEQYNGDDIRKYFEKYEEDENREVFGNYVYGDGAKYRGGGAIQMTGKNAYKAFSEYMKDDKILSDGALYVGQNYYWESAGFFWSIYKPSTAGDDRYNFNQKCDNNESVEVISRIVNPKMDDEDVGLREKAYSGYIKMFE